jgi:hypothetical protein
MLSDKEALRQACYIQRYRQELWDANRIGDRARALAKQFASEKRAA